MRLKKKPAEQAIDELDPQKIKQYAKYWHAITPHTDEERWKRWIFALCSAQLNWQQNVEAYQAIMTMPWATKDELVEVLVGSRSGMYNSNAKCVCKFDALHKAQLKKLGYNRLLGHINNAGYDNWTRWRDNFVEKGLVFGAGPKVASFGMELCHPDDCRVIAADVHLLRLYGVPKDEGGKLATYKRVEDHWVSRCDIYGYSPIMARHVWWDSLHDEDSTRYWSHIFEPAGLEPAKIV